MTFTEIDAPSGVHAGIWEPAGEPAGTVLALHGITSSHRAWTPLARALPEYRIVAPDLRGRGGSRHLPGPYGMARHADDAAALLDHLGVDHVLPVGHSMGGFVAVVLAHRHPRLLDRLVLVDGGLPLALPPGIDPEAAVAATLGPAAQRLSMTFPTPDAYADFWRAHPSFADFTPDVADYVAYDLVGEAPELRPATSYEAMAADSHDLVRPADENALVAALAALAVPATFLRAEFGMMAEPGGLFPADYVAGWAARLPGFTVRDVPGVNHYTITLSDAGAAAVAQAVREG